jgi:hypothetical protein
VLEGCPDDGPSMAIDAQNRVHIVWPTLVQEGGAEPNIALFYAMSRDGKTFTPRERVSTQGTPHHPQLVVDRNGRLSLTWDELEGGKRHVAFARAPIAASGSPKFAREVISEGDPAVYPMAAATANNEALVAWTSGASTASVIRVVRIP